MPMRQLFSSSFVSRERTSRSIIRRCSSSSLKTCSPARVGWTSPTRRSSSPWRRSTRPRCSIRSTMPVALATDTSSASASRLIAIGPSPSRIVRTCSWMMLSEPCNQRRNMPIRSRGFHAPSSLTQASSISSRRRLVNVTLTIYAMLRTWSTTLRRASAPAAAERRRARDERPEATAEEHRLAVDQLEEVAEPVVGRRRLEECLATRQLDLDDPGEEVRERRRVIRDDDAAADRLVPLLHLDLADRAGGFLFGDLGVFRLAL